MLDQGYKRAPSFSTKAKLLMHAFNHQLLAALQYPARDLELSGRLEELMQNATSFAVTLSRKGF
jgi:hypothetical protein